MKVIHAFTSAARNYLPKVRLLADSIRRHHPEWRIHLALADDGPLGADPVHFGVDEVHPVSRLDIPGVRAWIFGHTLVELSTAIKPTVLRKLMAREDCRGVVYLDPDIVLFSPLVEVESALEDADLLLTPHLTDPDIDREVAENERSALRHGAYNLGFLAVSPSMAGCRFAEWWERRCLRFCRDDIRNGLFTDQRWIDLAPGLFPGTRILRGSRLNVAPWNIATRRVTGTVPHGMLVDGEPLGFYHFTGFDSGAHRAMAMKYAAGQPAVHRLLDWYAEATGASATDQSPRAPWAFGAFSDGSPIPAQARAVFRDRPDLQGRYADPFDAQGFKAWWQCHAAAPDGPKDARPWRGRLRRVLSRLQRSLRVQPA